MTIDAEFSSSSEVLDAYIARSWRSNAERQRAKGAEFVIGRREGVYMWDLEGKHRLIDCGIGGGVHSLGHRHPAVVAALRQALDDGRDTGLWSVPNVPYLRLQDRLAELSPSPDLTHSVVTLCSTLSIDVATMFAFRVTGRSKILSYRHGYHGHSGFAAMITGSADEGVIDHYNLPGANTTFFETYGDLDEIAEKMTPDVAAIIFEPMDYETFTFASRAFLDGVTRLCRARGTLFIIDETRTGIGRTGKLWASEHYDLRPDILITGKGLSGGLYPVSALLMRGPIYETCMNQHKFSYISSLGGNEISCLVALAVLEVASQPAMLAHVNAVSAHLAAAFAKVGHNHPDIIGPVTALGCVHSVAVRNRTLARQLYANLYRHGVLCHSVSEIEPPSLKFFTPITITEAECDEIVAALRGAIGDLD